MNILTVCIEYIGVYVQMTETLTVSKGALMPIVPNALLPLNAFISHFLIPSRNEIYLLML